MSKKQYLIGVFSDEHSLVEAFDAVKRAGIPVEEVYTPYPVHEILHGMGRKTHMTHAAFLFGLFGAVAVLSGMYYAAVISWPLHFGGKPFNVFPSFLVVTIVATILIITLGTLFTFSARAKIFPGKKAEIVDIRATDDKFVLVLCKDELGERLALAGELLTQHGAAEVYENEPENTTAL